MIDVLLVILIFLMITTTYSKFSEMEISLPQATSDKPAERSDVINILVSAAGAYKVNGAPVEQSTTEELGSALRKAAGEHSDPVIVIHADADATHQAVIRVMEAARLTGYNHITFTTENPR
jgi:biopolymer transport protein ExbD